MADFLDIDRFLELQDTIIDFKLNEASGNVVSSGEDGTGLQGALSLAAGGTPTYQESGPTIGDNLLAIGFDGVGDYFQELVTGIVNTSLDTFGPGIGIIFKSPAISAKGTLFSSAQNDHSRFVEISILADGSIEVDTTSTGGQYREISTTTGLDDGNWHFIWVDNYQDGTGMSMTIDATQATLSRTLTGSATIDQWFTLVQGQYPAGEDNMAIAATAGTTPGTFFEGSINRIFSLVHRRFRLGDILTAFWNRVENGAPTTELGRMALGGPFHWYQCQEASGNLLDTGMAHILVPLDQISGTPVYQATGPRDIPFAIDLEIGSSESFFGDNPSAGINIWPYGDSGSMMGNFNAESDITAVPWGFTSISSSVEWFRWAMFMTTRDMQVFNSDSVGINYSENIDTPDMPIATWTNFVSQSPSGGPWEHYIDGVAPTGITKTGNGGWTEAEWWNEHSLARMNIGAFKRGATALESYWDGTVTNVGGWAVAILTAADIDVIINGPPAPAPGGEFFDELLLLNPDWYWRNNEGAAPVIDRGVAQVRPGPSPPPINADTIAEQGNPVYGAPGPLPGDASNAAIYFDGTLDSLEIGVNGGSNTLAANSNGTWGGFIARNSNGENIAFSIGNDAYDAFWQIGFNGDQIELIVQRSTGNLVTLTSGKALFLDASFVFVVITSDGSNYDLYINGSLDPTATIVETGSGVEGDWFGEIGSADRTMMAARSDTAMTTETNARLSELFLFDTAVLTEIQVTTLWDAAIRDGVLGTPNPVGLLSFENVTFKNGAFADIRAESSDADFQQILRVSRCSFVGGAQGTATYKPRIASIKGPVIAQFSGCSSELSATPVMGRAGIIGSAIDPTAVATVDGNLSVVDCDFSQLGYFNGTDVLAAVMCEAAFGMTVKDSRFTDCFTAAIGWLADSRRVAILNNQITGTTNAANPIGGAIYSTTGLNDRSTSNGWLIRGNNIVDTAGNAINIEGKSGSIISPVFATNIAIIENKISNAVVAGMGIRAHEVADVLIAGNKINFVTDGVRVGECSGVVAVHDNDVSDHTATAVICSEAAQQSVDLSILRNKVKGLAAGFGSGVTVANVLRAAVLDNELSKLSIGIQIGASSGEITLSANQAISDVSTPFGLLSGTINSLRIGDQLITDIGAAELLPVASNAVTAIGHYHTANSAVITDLDTIDGPLVNGFLLILQRAAGSQTITAKDGVDNLNLAGDFALSTDGSQLWLTRTGTDWSELSRFTA